MQGIRGNHVDGSFVHLHTKREIICDSMRPSVGTGEVVLVKSFPSDPVVRRIFEEKDDWVMLCLDEEFRLWQDKGIRPLTVKCPKTRVFKYDHQLFLKLKEAAYSLVDNGLLETLWNQAESYYDSVKTN